MVFIATTVAVRRSELVPALPWGLLIAVAVIALPIAMSLQVLQQIEPALRRRATLGYAVCGAAASLLLLSWHVSLLWPLLALALFLVPEFRVPVKNWRVLVLAIFVLLCGYGAVFNVNYLLIRHLTPGRWDPMMRELDLVFYRWWFGSEVDLTGRFPLVSHILLLRAFDNAYWLLVPEIIVVTFSLAQLDQRRHLNDFLQRLFGLYAAGIVIYMIFPVNGPQLFYPHQQDLSRSLEGTVALSNGMMHDYRVAQTGGRLAGFGYFIAVPSLHVLVAVFLQHCLRAFRVLFVVFLPINVMMCLSTVVLGYHYLLDSVAALAVYGLVLAVAGPPWRGLPPVTRSSTA